ncbi:MAG: PLP-dependent aminotransferase family protein [Planctomycetota bacterium]|nr:PLP-dependent aminotransferase family protein [Planctomycetota bacterium]
MESDATMASNRPADSSTEPLHRQLYTRLREDILARRLAPGSKLPSTRALAQDLRLSRNTVLGAYDQLLAEGYLECRQGSGTYVAQALPEGPVKTTAGLPKKSRAPRHVSKRGRLLARTPLMAPHEIPPGAPDPISFRPGVPAVDAALLKEWKRASRRLDRLPGRLLGYGPPEGHETLRRAVAAYLATARGVRCSYEQVLIVNGSQQALDLASRVLLDPGDPAAVEEPGYLGAKGAYAAAGAKIVPVPIDEAGIALDRMPKGARPRVVYVTPSFQYPLGVTMPLPRRLALLDWASRTGAWILEDDYDSEYRYAGRPIEALQGLDEDGRVIYMGTFSKTVFPGLRLAFVVVPPDLIEPFAGARRLCDHHSPAFEQAVLAQFLEDGRFVRHLKRMRAMYRRRQEALIAAVRERLGGLVEIRPADAGMHVLAWLPPGWDDVRAATHAARAGIETLALSRFCLRKPARGALLLGYTALEEPRMREGVRRLAAALQTFKG